MPEPPVHPEVAHLAYLLGTWQGEGEGAYPTIAPFRYGEEISFFHAGKPWLGYRQRTWSLDGGAPMHAEVGYVRPAGPGRIEWVLAHPTGIVEIEEGTVAGGVIEVASTMVARTSTAKDVQALGRSVRVEGDTLTYEVAMAIAGHPLTPHLTATLHRA